MYQELLLIPEKLDPERTAVAQAWTIQGGEVMSIGQFWIKPNTQNKRVTIYGPDTFSLVLAQVLDLSLISPKDEELALVEWPFVQRNIHIVAVKDVATGSFPCFLKPVVPKQFAAQIVSSLSDAQEIIQGLDEQELLLCSTIILIEKEVRAFVLNLEILDLAYYEGQGDLATATDFLRNFLTGTTLVLPLSFVVDLGWNAVQGWFLIEFNASWGAGLNGCTADKVLYGIRAACRTH